MKLNSMSVFTFQNNKYDCLIELRICFFLKKSLLFYLQTRVEHITQKPRIKKQKQIIITNQKEKYIIFVLFLNN